MKLFLKLLSLFLAFIGFNLDSIAMEEKIFGFPYEVKRNRVYYKVRDVSLPEGEKGWRKPCPDVCPFTFSIKPELSSQEKKNALYHAMRMSPPTDFQIESTQQISHKNGTVIYLPVNNIQKIYCPLPCRTAPQVTTLQGLLPRLEAPYKDIFEGDETNLKKVWHRAFPVQTISLRIIVVTAIVVGTLLGITCYYIYKKVSIKENNAKEMQKKNKIFKKKVSSS